MDQIGFIYNLRQGEVPQSSYLLYRVVPMGQVLRDAGLKLFVYSPRHIDKTTETVPGYLVGRRACQRADLPVPRVNGNWFLGRGDRPGPQRMSASYFREWAESHDIDIYPPYEFSQLVKDKFATWKLVSGIDPDLHPYTEVYAGRRSQIECFLQRADRIFLKPRQGNKGDGILLVASRDGELVLTLSKDRRTTESRHQTRVDLLQAIRTIIGGDAYVIQTGIDAARSDGAAFIIRSIMLHDGDHWHAFHKAVRAAGRGDVANTSQGGTNHHPEEVLEEVFGDGQGDPMTDLVDRDARRLTDHLDRLHPGRLMEIAFDFVIDTERRIHLVEINTKPGMTKPGLPKGAFRDIFDLAAEERDIYDRLVLPHASCLARFLLVKHRQRCCGG